MIEWYTYIISEEVQRSQVITDTGVLVSETGPEFHIIYFNCAVTSPLKYFYDIFITFMTSWGIPHDKLREKLQN